jgi:phosphoglycolate phosphatase-like HAD superfamily hydrolase
MADRWSKGSELARYKKLARIADLIDGGTSSDDAAKSKPHPDIFQAALKTLDRVAPQNVIVVGDTPYDAEAAGKAGLCTIGVLCGGFPEESLRQSGCIAVFADPADLLARYLDSPLAKKTG